MNYRCCFVIGAISFVSPAAMGQWSTDPGVNTAVSVGAMERVLCKVAACADGSCYVSWFQVDPVAAGGFNYNVYLQRFDSAGVSSWPGGLLVSDAPQNTSLVDYHLMADRDGHAVVTWTDIRDGGDLDVFAQRVSPAGVALWGNNGAQLSFNAASEQDPRVVQNAEGDFVFVWPRTGTSAPGLYMQTLTPTGTPTLPAGGQLLLTGSITENPAFHEMLATPDNSVVVCWVRDITRFNSLRHIMIQKFGTSTLPVWTAVSPLVVSSAISVPIAHRPKLVADESGGVVVAWHDTRNSNRFDCWVQRFSDSGVPSFAANGFQVSLNNTYYHLDPAVCVTGGEIVVAYSERTTSQGSRGLYAQRIAVGGGGSRLWGPGGIELAPIDAVDELFVRAVPGRVPGDTTLVYFDGPSGTVFNRVYATQLRADGAARWSSTLCTVNSAKGRLPVAAFNGSGGVVAAWEDNRSGTVGMYAQTFATDGTLGPPISCNADFTGDGFLDAFDYDAFVACFEGEPCPPGKTADFTGDGFADAFDYDAYVSAFEEGC